VACCTARNHLDRAPARAEGCGHTAELGMPEINYTMWHGLYVAKGTPKEIVAVINEALRKAISIPMSSPR